MTDTAKLAARAVEAVDDGELVKLLQRMIRGNGVAPRDFT